MHKIYSISYTLNDGDQIDGFWQNFLFTEEELPPVKDYTYHSFDDFYDDAVSNKLPVMIDYGKTVIRHEPYIRIDGYRLSHIITKRNFTDPTSIRVECYECSPKYYGFDFYKQKLSSDDFMCFMQEHYGVEALTMAMDNTGRS